MCNHCAFLRRPYDACGEMNATFCCQKCGIHLCYKCTVGMVVGGLKKVGACPMCGAKLS